MFLKDLILLHPPSVYDFRHKSIMFGPISDVVPSSSVFEMYPVGITSIAEYLEKNDFNVQLINIAYQMLRNENYDPEKEIAGLKAKMFAIDLHWLPHTHGSIEIAKLLKKYHPKTPVIFGGFSASYFHEELVAYPFVDYVLRGDSIEEPFLQLINSLNKNMPLEDIPNLTWKKNGHIVDNPLTYVPDNMDYTGVPSYKYVLSSVFKYRNLHNIIPYLEWLSYPTTALLTSRGCIHNCSICGGSSFAYQKICNRSKPAFRSPKVLMEDIKIIQSFGKAPIFILNDLRQGGPDYTREFFHLLKQQQIDNEIVLELFSPADEDFFKMVADAAPKFSLEITLESHDQQLRKLNGKFPCSNKAFEDTLEAALKYKCRKIDIFFMTGIPKQTYSSALESIDYCRFLLTKFNSDPRLTMFIAPLGPFLDPGSLAYERPKKYGYKKFCHTLEDHYKALLQPSWKHILSYETDSMTRDEIVKATYDCAAGLNLLKYEFGLIKKELYESIDYQITCAKEVIAEIDKVMLIGDENLRAAELEKLQQKVKKLNSATLCGKDELKWPIGEGFADTLSLLRLGGSLFFTEVVGFIKRMIRH